VNGVLPTLALVGAAALAGAVARRSSRNAPEIEMRVGAQWVPPLERQAGGSRNAAAIFKHCDDGLYHVTRVRLLPAIRARGLVANPPRIRPTFSIFAETGHVANRVFLAAGIPAATGWWMSIRILREEEGRAGPGNRLSLLRIRPDRVAAYADQLQHDTEGARDVHRCSFYLQGSRVAPEDLEIARPSASFGRTMPEAAEKAWDEQVRSTQRPFTWRPLL